MLSSLHGLINVQNGIEQVVSLYGYCGFMVWKSTMRKLYEYTNDSLKRGMVTIGT